MKNEKYIVPLNLSKLGFRYFRILLESKLFSKKFLEYVINHPNTGYVFEGSGWSGKKRLLGIGIWAANNAEISDIATNIRSIIPSSYKVVYQSELTRLEYFREIDGKRTSMLLIDELDQKIELSALEFDYLKLLSTDGSLQKNEQAALLGISNEKLHEIEQRLLKDNVYYGVFTDGPLPNNYTKLFVDTTALTHEVVEYYFKELKEDKNCIYLARGNGRYNVEFEYVVDDKVEFNEQYGPLLKSSKSVQFDTNVYTNLFPQSKSLNTKMVQEKFLESANQNQKHFDFSDSELWYVNHEGIQGYLDIYQDADYSRSMQSGETSLFTKVCDSLPNINNKFNVVDLGSGDGKKGKSFIESLGESRVKAYFPVDIQELELSQAVRVHEMSPYGVYPTVIGFDNLSARFPLVNTKSESNIYCLFGGTYGNFKPETINGYLSPLLVSADDRVLVGMPISDFVSKNEIINSYATKQIEKIAFGVLKQIGFSREAFLSSKSHPDLKLHLHWEEDRLRTSFVLAESKRILDLYMEKGTVFDITSSWKPTLSEFREVLNKDFMIEKMVSNRSFAIAVCKRKPNN